MIIDNLLSKLHTSFPDYASFKIWMYSIDQTGVLKGDESSLHVEGQGRIHEVFRKRGQVQAGWNPRHCRGLRLGPHSVGPLGLRRSQPDWMRAGAASVCSGNQFFNDFPVYVGEAEIAPGVMEGELLVIESEKL